MKNYLNTWLAANYSLSSIKLSNSGVEIISDCVFLVKWQCEKSIIFFSKRQNELAFFVHKKHILNLFNQKYETGKYNRHDLLQSPEWFSRSFFFRAFVPYIRAINRNFWVVKKLLSMLLVLFGSSQWDLIQKMYKKSCIARLTDSENRSSSRVTEWFLKNEPTDLKFCTVGRVKWNFRLREGTSGFKISF